jgi:peptide deformylase
MSKLNIVIAPDPVLKAVANPIARVDDNMRSFVEDMFETMYAARGVGLAAPQVAVSQRVIVMDPVREDNATPQPLALVNPEIIWRSEEPNVFEEGCLSLPEFYVEVERPASIRLRYTDLQNVDHEMLADGFMATVLQHEIDHLNGVLLLDYVSKLKRDLAVKKLIKLKKDREVL